MTQALIAHLERKIASGNIPSDQKAVVMEEIHRLRSRVVRPRDASRDDHPIVVGVAK